MKSRAELFDDSARKRGAPDLMGGITSAKRQKMGDSLTGSSQFPPPVLPLGPGPHTVRELFTATTEDELKTLDVQLLPAEMVLGLNIKILSMIDAATLVEQVKVSIVDRLPIWF
jgi:symplekin